MQGLRRRRREASNPLVLSAFPSEWLERGRKELKNPPEQVQAPDPPGLIWLRGPETTDSFRSASRFSRLKLQPKATASEQAGGYERASLPEKVSVYWHFRAGSMMFVRV